MRVLYHFTYSTFSRRTRLALAHKGLEVELREGRANPADYAEARAHWPVGTLPVLVDDGRVLGDSTAIAHYLDAAYPDRPRLWPAAPAAMLTALEVTSLVDASLNLLVDVGTRYYALRQDPAWPAVLEDRMARAQAAMDKLATRAAASSAYLAGDAWSVADMWSVAAVRWIRTWPERAAVSPLVAQIQSLGLRLPEALATWAAQHDARDDVRAIFTP